MVPAHHVQDYSMRILTAVHSNPHSHMRFVTTFQDRDDLEPPQPIEATHAVTGVAGMEMRMPGGGSHGFTFTSYEAVAAGRAGGHLLHKAMPVRYIGAYSPTAR